MNYENATSDLQAKNSKNLFWAWHYKKVVTISPQIFKLKRILSKNENYSSALFSFAFLGVEIMV